jgi:hypothetical protein
MKKLFFLALALCISGFTFSQSFTQGVGISVYVQSANNFTADPVGAITYSPRVNFAETESSSFSIGIPMSFGVSGSYNSQNYYGDNNLAVMFDAPLVFNFNYCAGSSKESEDKWGFFAGAGFGYHMNQLIATDQYGGDYSIKMAGFGPVGNAGVRLGVGHGSHNLELRASYMKTLDVTKSGILGIGVLFNF